LNLFYLIEWLDDGYISDQTTWVPLCSPIFNFNYCFYYHLLFTDTFKKTIRRFEMWSVSFKISHLRWNLQLGPKNQVCEYYCCSFHHKFKKVVIAKWLCFSFIHGVHSLSPWAFEKENRTFHRENSCSQAKRRTSPEGIYFNVLHFSPAIFIMWTC
jgi:hypothetical protein